MSERGHGAAATLDPAPSTAVILCRFGEIFLKGRNRAFFERKLVDNIRRAVEGTGARVERLHGRMLVHLLEGNAAQVLDRLGRVFGLQSMSPAALVERSEEAIAAAAVAEARAAIAEAGRPLRFKVESRRSDKRFEPASPELSRRVGAAVVGALGLPVDLHEPELQIGVEVGFEHAYVWGRSAPGPGGLPVGTSGEVDLLLSGGIDSPVAGYLMMKRGCHIAATYFHSFPYTGDRTKEKVARLASLIARHQGSIELRVVPFTDAQKALRAAGDPRYAVVLYRRMMVRVAEQLARRRGALALVTGDALGQVASQTLENLTTIGAVATLPILRPLTAHDKLETIAWAKRIGTYEVSIEPYEDCCSLFLPDHPATKARLADVLAIEAKLDLPALVEGCVAGVETIRCVG